LKYLPARNISAPAIFFLDPQGTQSMVIDPKEMFKIAWSVNRKEFFKEKIEQRNTKGFL
jgi:hypothetical protein